LIASQEIALRGAAFLVLGNALSGAGKMEEAGMAATEAVRLFAQKGNLVRLDEARSLHAKPRRGHGFSEEATERVSEDQPPLRGE
jgi:hypothetical protein